MAAKAERTETFDIDIKKFYECITDYESYPDFVDGVSFINVLEKTDNSARVEYGLNLIKKFTYILNMKQDSPNGISWSFESGDIFKKNEGAWKLVDLGDGKTEVTYELDVDFKGFVPKAIVNKLVSGNLPSMMKSYFERASR